MFPSSPPGVSRSWSLCDPPRVERGGSQGPNYKDESCRVFVTQTHLETGVVALLRRPRCVRGAPNDGVRLTRGELDDRDPPVRLSRFATVCREGREDAVCKRPEPPALGLVSDDRGPHWD